MPRRTASDTLRGLVKDGISYLFEQKNMTKEALDSAVENALLNDPHFEVKPIDL